MKFSGIAALLSATAFVAAHPEKHEKGSAAAQMQHELVARGSNKCAAQIEARKAAVMEKRKRSLYKRQVADGRIKERRGISEIEKRANKYAEIQNTTCVLAPDTIWGPYG